jgi:hypothetical protein
LGAGAVCVGAVCAGAVCVGDGAWVSGGVVSLVGGCCAYSIVADSKAAAKSAVRILFISRLLRGGGEFKFSRRALAGDHFYDAGLVPEVNQGIRV